MGMPFQDLDTKVMFILTWMMTFFKKKLLSILAVLIEQPLQQPKTEPKKHTCKPQTSFY